MSFEITLTEAQKLIRQLERQIEHTVQEFHDNTRLRVMDIELDTTELTDLSDERPRFGYRVKVEVRL